MQQGYPVVATPPQKATGTLLHCALLLPLHVFFQLFYSRVSPRRRHQEVLQFLGRSYYFSFRVVQGSLQVVNTVLRLKMLFFQVPQL